MTERMIENRIKRLRQFEAQQEKLETAGRSSYLPAFFILLLAASKSALAFLTERGPAFIMGARLGKPPNA